MLGKNKSASTKSLTVLNRKSEMVIGRRAKSRFVLGLKSLVKGLQLRLEINKNFFGEKAAEKDFLFVSGLGIIF